MAAPIGKLGKAGKAVLMSKTSHLRVVHDHYAQAPGPGELLVHNVYSSVNPVDCYMHSGAYKVQFLPKVLGSDVAGQVIQAPEGSKFSVYDKVFALTDGYLGGADARGSFAEYVRVKEEWVAAVPPSLPLREAAAVPLAGLTAWQALQAAPPGGGRLLLLGASGGVGQFCVQLATLRGWTVVGTCSAPHAQRVRELGAAETFDYAAGCDALGQAFGAADDARKFDCVLDLVGGDLLHCAASRLLKPGATVVHVRNRGCDAATAARLEEEVTRRGGRWHNILVKPSGEQLQQLAELLEAGKLKVTIAAVMPLEEVAQALKMVEDGHAGGKVLLKVV